MSMHNERMSKKPARSPAYIPQKLFLAFELFTQQEMANHAAAGAYGFLLSAIPAILVIIFISSRIMTSFDPKALLAPLEPFLGAFGGKESMMAFLAKPLASFTGVFGFINLVWAARLFIVSVQRGIRVVYGDSDKSGAVRDNILTFGLELLVIIVIVLIISISQLARMAMAGLSWLPVAFIFNSALKLVFHLLPALSLWAFVFITYARLPLVKPKIKTVALGSVLCVASYMVLASLLNLILNAEKYGLLYGILGSLVAGLIKVYFFFWLYFYFSELCYTIEYFDSLLFARFYEFVLKNKETGKLEKKLFRNPEQLFMRHSRFYPSGSTIFCKGDTDNSIYYLYKGSISIFLSFPDCECQKNKKVNWNQVTKAQAFSEIKEGEFFGEMAFILDKPRSAFAIAREDSTVFELNPKMFSNFLEQNSNAAIVLNELLAARLLENNDLYLGTEKQ